MNEDFEDFLTQIALLPFDDWLKECKTDDQKKNWHEMKLHYVILYWELRSYFAGTQSPLDILDKDISEFFKTWGKTYLSLYEVVRDAWDCLVFAAGELNIPLPEKPKSALMQIAVNDCRGIFEQHQRFFQFRPRLLHDLYSQTHKIAALRKKDNPSEKEIKAIKRFDAAVNRSYHEHQKVLKLRLFCIEAAEYYSKSDKILKKSLQRYRMIISDLDAILARSVHPSRRVKGFDIKEGTKIFLT